MKKIYKFVKEYYQIILYTLFCLIVIFALNRIDTSIYQSKFQTIDIKFQNNSWIIYKNDKEICSFKVKYLLSDAQPNENDIWEIEKNKKNIIAKITKNNIAFEQSIEFENNEINNLKLKCRELNDEILELRYVLIIDNKNIISENGKIHRNNIANKSNWFGYCERFIFLFKNQEFFENNVVLNGKIHFFSKLFDGNERSIELMHSDLNYDNLIKNNSRFENISKIANLNFVAQAVLKLNIVISYYLSFYLNENKTDLLAFFLTILFFFLLLAYYFRKLLKNTIFKYKIEKFISNEPENEKEIKRKILHKKYGIWFLFDQKQDIENLLIFIISGYYFSCILYKIDFFFEYSIISNKYFICLLNGAILFYYHHLINKQFAILPQIIITFIMLQYFVKLSILYTVMLLNILLILLIALMYRVENLEIDT